MRSHRPNSPAFRGGKLVKGGQPRSYRLPRHDIDNIGESDDSEGATAVSGLADQMYGERPQRPAPAAKPAQPEAPKFSPAPRRPTPSSKPPQQAVVADPNDIEVDEEVVAEQLRPAKKNGATPRYVKTSVPEGWTRISVPSNCVPYDFKEIHVRPFDVTDLAGLAVSRKHGNYTMFLDVIDNAVNVDVRDLTGPDQRYLMYWWRITSYVDTPYDVTWISRYGNENKVSINKTNLKTVELKMTEEEYAPYKEMGIVFPTVRDSEALQEEMSDEMRFLMERAQYMRGDPDAENYAQSKIDQLKAGGIAILEKIRDFSKQIEHGVIETIKVTDSQFEPNAAVEYLDRAAVALMYTAENGEENGIEASIILQQIERARDLAAEAAEIKEKLAIGEPILPKEEVVTLNINVTAFFPEI